MVVTVIFFRRMWIAGALCLALAGCASVPDTRTAAVEAEPLGYANLEIEEKKLLNVWVKWFDHADVDSNEAKETGTSEEIREAESRFIPVHLKDTLQATGYWGAVRVVPESGLVGGEMVISGVINRSSGRTLDLDISARDALGKVWLKRHYSVDVVPANYRDLRPREWDAFQSVYNEIANDLAKALDDISLAESQRIREAAELRFAAHIAPQPFEDYIDEKRNGRIEVERLPAENDPNYQRVISLKARNDMLADVLNGHYDQFYDEIWDPYTEWRRSSLKEILALERTRQSANAKKLGGIAAIIGAIGLEALGGKTARNTGTVQTVMVVGGAMAVKAGIDQSAEKEMYVSAIRELGDSFKSEIEPMVMELDGETIELTGSADAQFARWRELLRDRYDTERGLVSNSETDPSQFEDPAEADAPVSID